MKKLLLLLTLMGFLAFVPSISFAQRKSGTKSSKPKAVHVKSYTTKTGKHVKSHYRSKPVKRKHAYILEAAENRRIIA